MKMKLKIFFLFRDIWIIASHTADHLCSMTKTREDEVGETTTHENEIFQIFIFRVINRMRKLLKIVFVFVLMASLIAQVRRSFMSCMTSSDSHCRCKSVSKLTFSNSWINAIDLGVSTRIRIIFTFLLYWTHRDKRPPILYTEMTCRDSLHSSDSRHGWHQIAPSTGWQQSSPRRRSTRRHNVEYSEERKSRHLHYATIHFNITSICFQLTLNDP